MSLGVGSDKEGGVSSRRVLRVMGEDAVGSSDAERLREETEVDDSIEGDLYRLRPSALDKSVGCDAPVELVKFCIARRGNAGSLSPQLRVSLSSHGHLSLPDGCSVCVSCYSSLRHLSRILLSAKHFLSDPASLVVQSLQGLCAINPKLGLDTTNKGSPICTTGINKLTSLS